MLAWELRTISIVTLLCTVLAFASSATAEQWRMPVQNADLSPFKHRNGWGPGGINVDVMSAIAHELDIHLEFLDVSVAEGRHLFKQGKATVDCCLNEIWFPGQEDLHVFSKPIYHLIEVFIFPEGEAFAVPDTTVLADKTVAGIDGFTYPGQENYGRRVNGETPLEVLKMVHERKVDVGVLERHAASFHINHNELEVQFGDPYYSVEVSVRLHKSQAHHLDDVNRVIDKLKKSGMIAQIIARNIH